MTLRLVALALSAAAVLASASTSTARDRPGVLDAGYGMCGTFTLPARDDLYSDTTPVALTPSRRPVIAGTTSADDVFVARLATDGSPDASFGSGGTAIADARIAEGESFSVQGVAVQADGRIVVAGSVSLANSDRSRPLLARFTADGRTDSTFGDAGVRSDVLPDPGSESFNAVTLDSSDRIVTAGQRDERFTVARFLPDGRPDMTFGVAGTAKPATRLRPAGANDVAVLPDGRIVAAGFADRQFAIVRLQPGGALDPTFGTGGLNVTSPPASASIDALAVAPDGRIVVAGVGENINKSNIALGRYKPNGAIDPSFGRKGFVLEPDAADAGAVLLAPDDGILLRAAVADNRGAVIRYRSDGSRETAFGRDGVASGNSEGQTGGMVLQADGGLLVPYTTSTTADLQVDRYAIAQPAVQRASGQPSVCGLRITSTRLREVLDPTGGPPGLTAELDTTRSRSVRLAATVTIKQRTSRLIRAHREKAEGGRTFLYLRLTRDARAALKNARRARFTVTVSDSAGRRLATVRAILRR